MNVAQDSGASGRLYRVRFMAAAPVTTDDPRRGEVPRDGSLRFGVFELDLRADELRKAGHVVRLQPQPLKLLRLLAGHPRRLFTREEIQRELWGDDVHVDYEQGINFCVRRVRAALGDQVDSPRFVETVPRRGYRWIGPVEWVAVEEPPPLGAASPSAVTPVTPVAVPAQVTPAGLPWRLLALLPALAVLAGVIFIASRAVAPAGPRWTRVTFRQGMLISARFGHPGELIYTAAWDGQPRALFTGHIGEVETRVVPVPASAVIGVCDGGELAVIYRAPSGRSMLARVAPAGGPLKDVLARVWVADWDGHQFAVVRRDPAGNPPFILEYPLGNVVARIRRSTAVRVSPDRRHVAVLEHFRDDDDRGHVLLFDRGGARRELGGVWASTGGLAWSARGDEVWIAATREGSDLGLHALSLEGEERELLPAAGRLVLHDVDAGGRTLIERAALHFELPFSAGGETERNLAVLGMTDPAALSADGRTLLVVETGEGAGGEYTTFVRDTDGSPAVRVGDGRGTDLSPDGRFVAALPVRNPDRVIVLPVGEGVRREVRFDGLERYSFVGFHPDGRRLVFTAAAPGAGERVYVGERDGGPARALTPPGVVIRSNTITPDGRGFVTMGPDLDLWIWPLDGGAPRRVPETQGHEFLGFADGARELFVARSARFPIEVERVDAVTGKRRPWRTLRPADTRGTEGATRVRITPGGGAYLYAYPRQLSELFVVDGLR